MIRFVTFHAELTRGQHEVIKNHNTLLKQDFILEKMIGSGRGVSYEEMIHMLFSSARLFNPECICEVLTDLTTQFTVNEHEPEFLVHRFSVNPKTIMYSRLCSQIEYLKQQKERDDVVFLDSDMLINGELNCLFQVPFALGLTIRDDSEMPINGGIFFISGAHRDKATRILENVRDIYAEKYADQSTWWGDQLALREVIFGDSKQTTNECTNYPLSYLYSDKSDEIALFSCETYNYSPPYTSMYRDLARRRVSEVIIHFKGERKKLMFLYWQAFLRPLSPLPAINLFECLFARLSIFIHVPYETVCAGLHYIWSITNRSRPLEHNANL
jgi:hypothetical protein